MKLNLDLAHFIWPIMMYVAAKEYQRSKKFFLNYKGYSLIAILLKINSLVMGIGLILSLSFDKQILLTITQTGYKSSFFIVPPLLLVDVFLYRIFKR